VPGRKQTVGDCGQPKEGAHHGRGKNKNKRGEGYGGDHQEKRPKTEPVLPKRKENATSVWDGGQMT